MKAVILAGGEGTRLRPLTCNIPKPMVPILNVPFLEHMLHYLKAHGVRDVILAMGYLPDHIQRHFGDGSAWGVHLFYSVEKKPLGTAGAVKNAESYLDDTFLVFNGDIFTTIDLTALLAFHRQRRAKATIALTPVSDPTKYGVVETDEHQQVLRFTEKPAPDQVRSNLINAGIYVLEADCLELMPADSHYMFERGVFPGLLDRGDRLFGLDCPGYWIDIGTAESYLKLHHDLLLGQAGAAWDGDERANCSVHPTAQVVGPVLMARGCSIGARSRLIGPVVLGPDCMVGEDAMIEGSVLWQGVSVGSGVSLKNCILARECQVEDGGSVGEGCVLGDGVYVGQGSKLEGGAKLWPRERREALECHSGEGQNPEV